MRTTWSNKEVPQTFSHNSYFSRKYSLICLAPYHSRKFQPCMSYFICLIVFIVFICLIKPISSSISLSLYSKLILLTSSCNKFYSLQVFLVFLRFEQGFRTRGHRRRQDFWFGRPKPQMTWKNVIKNIRKRNFLRGKVIVEWKIKSRGLCLALNPILLKGQNLNQ